jgi:hypothetical protein
MERGIQLDTWSREWLDNHAGEVYLTPENRIRVVIPFEGFELWAEADTCVSAIEKLIRKLS